MKNKINIAILIGVFLSFQAYALESPFPSRLTDEGITIPNASVVGEGQGRVLRGSMPINTERDNIDQLVRAKVNHVLIFKTSVKGDVEKEIEALKTAGFEENQIHAVDFAWKEIKDYKLACLQTLDGLSFLRDAYNTKGKTVYLHCTVGEDRTGYLSGLFRQITEHGTADKYFKEEMCENGYEAGNPQKPQNVVKAIRESLTPLYFQMSELIRTKKITLDTLDRKACDIKVDNIRAKMPICQKSSRLQ